MLVSCNRTVMSNVRFEDDKSKSSSNTDQKTTNQHEVQGKPYGTNPDETVTVPSPITGASLRCAEEVKATADKIESLYGCQITDGKGKRQNSGISGVDYKFAWRPNSADAISVFIKNLPGDGRYDVLYLFRSPDLGTLTSSILNVGIVVQSKAADGGFSEALASLLSTVTVPKSAIPEPKASNYSAIRDQLTIEADGTSPTPPIP